MVANVALTAEKRPACASRREYFCLSKKLQKSSHEDEKRIHVVNVLVVEIFVVFFGYGPIGGPETKSHILYVEWHDRELVKCDHDLLQCRKNRQQSRANQHRFKVRKCGQLGVEHLRRSIRRERSFVCIVRGPHVLGFVRMYRVVVGGRVCITSVTFSMRETTDGWVTVGLITFATGHIVDMAVCHSEVSSVGG